MIANTSRLRLLAIKRTASHNSADHRTLDLPIIGWQDRDGRPHPVVVAELGADDVVRLFDPDQKVWYSLDGEQFDTYAKASAEAWQPAQAPAPAPEPALTEPSIGEVDHWGVGDGPGRPSGRRPKPPPPHPRENFLK